MTGTNYVELARVNKLAAIKAEINLAAVVLAYGVDLEPAGEGRLVGECPFHDDQSPSFAVWKWPEDGAWCCGCWSCGFHTGDVFDFLQKWHGVGFRQAVKLASRLRNLDDSPGAPLPSVSSGPAPDLRSAGNARWCAPRSRVVNGHSRPGSSALLT